MRQLCWRDFYAHVLLANPSNARRAHWRHMDALEPWTMTGEEQEAAGCVIGRDYPDPIVDHKQERERAMARYRAVRGS